MDLYTVGRREISSLRVKCDNVERSCTWEGIVDTLKDHVATCKFALLPCPNECKNHKNEILLMLRSNLDGHLRNDCPNRLHTCEYCKVKDTYAGIMVHQKVCKKKVLPCLNRECGKTLELQNLMQHILEECAYATISCKYAKIGCKVELQRKDMHVHELDDRVHIHQALENAIKLESDIRLTCMHACALYMSCMQCLPLKNDTHAYA